MFVTGVRVLAFPKIEIKRKSQKKFQTDFIKRLLECRAGNTVKRKVLCTDSGVSSAWLLYQLGTSRPVQKRRAFRKWRAFFTSYIAGNCVGANTVGARWKAAHYRHPRKVICGSSLDHLGMKNSGFEICVKVSS